MKLKKGYEAFIAAKKAKQLSEDMIPSTPDTTVQLEPNFF